MPAQVNFDEIRLLDRRQVAEAVGRSPDTLDGWVRDGLFPPPLQARPGGPKQWKLTTVRDWIAKRQRSRYQPPARRGRLRRGKIRTIPTRDPNVVQEVYLIRGGGPVDCDGPPPHKIPEGEDYVEVAFCEPDGEGQRRWGHRYFCHEHSAKWERAPSDD